MGEKLLSVGDDSWIDDEAGSWDSARRGDPWRPDGYHHSTSHLGFRTVIRG
jgi:hypothetical protein